MHDTPIPGRLRTSLAALGWAVAIPLGILIGYIALAIVLMGISSDAIAMTVLLNSVLAVGILVLRWRRPTWWAYDPPPRPVDDRGRFWLTVACCGLLAFAVGQGVGMWLHEHVGSDGFNASNTDRAAAGTMAIVLVLMVAPIAEELIFRGLMFPQLRRKAGVGISIVATTAAFALLHGNIVQIASALPLAVLLAIVYERTRVLWPLVLMHLGFNLAALIIPAGLLAPLVSPLASVPLAIAFGILAVSLLAPRATSAAAEGQTGLEPDVRTHRSS